MYDNGQGVTQDYAEVIKWYAKAAEQGDASAQYSLGVMYKNGQGVSQSDEEAAERWFTLAAKQGHIAAKESLEKIYAQEGIDTKKEV